MSKRVSPGAVRADIQSLAEELGRPPTSTEYQDRGEYTYQTAKQRFGGWEAAIDAAGFDYDEVPGPGENSGMESGGIRIVCPRCRAERYYTGDHNQATCRSCGHEMSVWRARIARGGRSEKIEKLASGPVVAETFNPHTAARQYRATLKVPGGSLGNTKPRPSPSVGTVHYLPGDERRAVTRFIEENTDYVADCLADGSNPLQKNWQDGLYQLLVEQWEWLGYGDEFDGEDGGGR